MSHPCATVEDLAEMLQDEDARIGKLLSARPVSWEAAFRKHEGLAAAKARKAALLGELASRGVSA